MNHICADLTSQHFRSLQRSFPTPSKERVSTLLGISPHSKRLPSPWQPSPGTGDVGTVNAVLLLGGLHLGLWHCRLCVLQGRRWEMAWKVDSFSAVSRSAGNVVDPERLPSLRHRPWTSTIPKTQQGLPSHGEIPSCSPCLLSRVPGDYQLSQRKALKP